MKAAAKETALTVTAGNACPHGSASAKPIELNFAQVKAFNNRRIHDIKEFTTPDYEQWLLGPTSCFTFWQRTMPSYQILPAPDLDIWWILEPDTLHRLLLWLRQHRRTLKFFHLTYPLAWNEHLHFAEGQKKTGKWL